MDQTELRLLENQCIQEHAPACTAGCPVRVDGRGLCAEIAKGNFNAALKLYQKTVPFPGIISRICDQPCRSACVRKDRGDALSLAALERACCDLGGPPAPPATLPSRGKHIAVIGSGLSGLTVCYDLAKKGYLVTLFEKLGRIGGGLWDLSRDFLPGRVIEKDLDILSQLKVEIWLNTTITSIGAGPGQTFDIRGQSFDAVYLGTGGDTTDAFGLGSDGKRKVVIDPVTSQTHRAGIFSGGGAIDHTAVSIGDPPKVFLRSPIVAVLDGHRAATSIDRYTQNVSLTASRISEGTYQTRLFASLKGIQPLRAVPIPEHAASYTREDAVREAERCIQCQCLECVKVCEYLKHYGSYPKRYVREIYNNLSIVKGERQKNQFINSCSLCGLCGEVCPEDLDMGKVNRKARQTMAAQKRMPRSAHEFALRDLAFSRSELFTLLRHQPGTERSRYLFFPGCQLSASSPDSVLRTYRYLFEKLGSGPDAGVGLALGCCGAPAEWAGRTDITQEVRERFLEVYHAAGDPVLILACSSCYRTFSMEYPEVKKTSLWTILDQYGLPVGTSRPRQSAPLVVHDPCATRYETGIQDAVRGLVEKLGYTSEELPLSREQTECCGYGGLVWLANPPMARKIVQTRIGEKPGVYVTYCAMCRDNFAKEGKPTYNLIDLIFPPESGETDPAQRGPDFSTRHENRARIKRDALRIFWGEPMEAKAVPNFEMLDLVRKTLEDRFILLEDIQQVIEHAEKTGRRLLNQKTGHYLAYHTPAAVTYWVEYSQKGQAYEIHNAYCHRMIVQDQR